MMKNRQVVRGDVWRNKAVLAAAKSAEARLFCVAYVTQASSKLFRRGDMLVCDASRKAVSFGETNPNFLLELFRKGVYIYSCEALHAKCAVFGDYVLLGSANLSESSANRLVELAVLLKDRSLAMKVQAFIGGLTKDAKILSEKELQRLCKAWNPRRSPWQSHLGKRKAECLRKWTANHVVTVYIRSRPNRCLSQEEISESKNKAARILEEKGFAQKGRSRDWYYTSETWGRRKPQAGDSIIVVEYNSGKENAHANVYGPGEVVMVERIRKVHMVHYLVPEQSLPYGKFRAEFDGKKSMNRYCVSDDEFKSMTTFIRREIRKRGR